MNRAKELHELGCSQKRIAQELGVHPKTIRRYLHSSSAKARRSRAGHLTDPFQSYLLKRWNEGCHNAKQLFREIQEQGYAGRTTMVRYVIREFRDASGLPPRIQTAKAEPLPTDPTRRLPTLRTLTLQFQLELEMENRALVYVINPGLENMNGTGSGQRGNWSIVSPVMKQIKSLSVQIPRHCSPVSRQGRDFFSVVIL